jgi:acyl carrier protein
MSALEDIIYPVVEVFQGTQREFKKDPNTALFGFDASLDSVALITFITGVEEQVRATTARTIRLVTPETLALDPSPFQTLGSLAAYLDKQLENGRGVRA